MYTHENFHEEKGSSTRKKFQIYAPPPGGSFTPEQKISFLFLYSPYTTNSHNCDQEVKNWELIFAFKFIKVEYFITFTHLHIHTFTHVHIYNHL